MPRLTHPDLPGSRLDVTEQVARVHRKSGWIDLDDVDTLTIADPDPEDLDAPIGDDETDSPRED